MILLFGIIFLGYIANDGDMPEADYWQGWYTTILLGGGYILTSIIFWEFKSPAGRIHLMTIPVSHLEKMCSRWFYTLILYPLILTIAYFVVYKIASGILGDAYWRPGHGENIGVTYRFYLIGHSIFFMLGILYNKYVAAKSAITVFVAIVVGSFIVVALFRIIFSYLFVGMEMNQGLQVNPDPAFQNWVEKVGFPLLTNFLIVIPVVFFLVVSFFKMQEKEV